MEKANRVADKYMIHEENIQVQVSRNRSRKPKAIRNSKEFQIALENYPNLKANESIMELLTQIKDTENGYAQSKLNYNADVEKYNTSIHSFPDVILKKLFGFQDAEFYNDESEHEVTDAELGI